MSEHFCKVVEFGPSTNLPSGKGVAIKLWEARYNGLYEWFCAPEGLTMEMMTIAMESFRDERTIVVNLSSRDKYSEIQSMCLYNSDYRR